MAHAHIEPPPIPLVMRMAVDISEGLGITIPSMKRLRKMISKHYPIPQMYRNRSSILWIDRYYIAFQLLADDQPVLYTYIAREHVAEELNADAKARRHRNAGFLDAPTRAQFAAAWRAMVGSRIGYATRELKPTLGQQSPLNLKIGWRCGHPLDEKTAPA